KVVIARTATTPSHGQIGFSLLSLCVLCASAVSVFDSLFTAETQRSQRIRREFQLRALLQSDISPARSEVWRCHGITTTSLRSWRQTGQTLPAAIFRPLRRSNWRFSER